MGINGLLKFLAKAVPSAVRKTHLSEYSGKKVAVDTSIFMFQHLYTRDHVAGFTRQTGAMLRNGIKPVFIFDGSAPEAKSDTVDDRRKIHEKNVSQKEILKVQLDAAVKQQVREFSTGAFDSSADIKILKKELNRLEQRTLHPTPQHFRDIRKLFKVIGVPYLNAKHEADWLCAQLNGEGLVDAVMSNDGDLLTNGASVLLTKYSSKDETVVEITLEKVLDGLDITQDQFIDMCIMSGCDYTKGIKGIGPAKALKLVKKHGFIEVILDNIKNPPEGFLPEAIEARRMFYHSPDDLAEVDAESLEPDLLPNGVDELSNFLQVHSKMKEKARNTIIESFLA